MADTTFVAQVTTIVSTWLNAVNNFIYRGRSPLYVTTGGSANAQTLTLPSGSLYSAYVDGDSFIFKAGFSNSGALTLQVIGSAPLAALPVQFNGVALAGSEIVSGRIYRVTVLGSTFQLGLAITTDGTLASNSDALIPSQKAVKTYADTKVSGTVTNHAVIIGAGGATVGSTAVGATNTVLHGNTGADPSYSAVVEADITLADNTTNDVSTTKHGFVPKAPNDTSKFLRGDGSWNAPSGSITLMTPQASTSGTSIDFTSIPSLVKRITVMFSGVSTNGTSLIQIQIGAGSVVTTGYASGAWTANTTNANSTTGFLVMASTVAAQAYDGVLELVLLNTSTNLWAYRGTISSSGAGFSAVGAGSIALSGSLDRVRITTVNGTDTFDAGSMNVSYQ